MKTVYTFKTNIFQPTKEELDETHEDYINPGIFARELADFLRNGLENRGYSSGARCAEDWGYWQEVHHSGGYTLAIGCANLDDVGKGPVEHRVFVEPHTPTIRAPKQWLRKVDVRSDVEKLVEAIGDLLRDDKRIHDVLLEAS
ncbi:MAG: hypothetical protein AB7O65_14800 [Candidatus Korobacteraceae bacterium]